MYQPESFLAIFVQDNTESFQEYHAGSFPELAQNTLDSVDMRFWFDLLMYNLIECDYRVSYLKKLKIQADVRHSKLTSNK